MILFLIPIGLCKTQLFYFTPQFPTPYHELYCKAIGANDQKKILTIIIVDRSTKIRLVRAYFTSFYGREPWHITNNCIEYICTAWRRGIRQVWRLPNTTHSSLLPGLCKTIPLLDLFYKRMLKFVYRCLINSQVIDCKCYCSTQYLVQSYELYNRSQCAERLSTLSHQHIQYNWLQL